MDRFTVSHASFLAGGRTLRGALGATFARAAVIAVAVVLAACGGSADAPPPNGAVGGQSGLAPTITQQPAATSVTAGQPVTFTVAATGTAPLAYQWQRDGLDIGGATSASYTLAAAALADSGATFRAAVSNVAGSATSNDAVLTVTASAPVLTVTQQPANASVAAGGQASFSAAATCSSGTVDVQWQKSPTAGGTFTDIAGANAATLSVVAAMADNGAQFRAVFDCSGQSSTASNAATLTVTAPGSATLAAFPVTGLHASAEVLAFYGIDQEASGSYVFIDVNRIRRLSADLTTIDIVANAANNFGTADGPGATAAFNQPQGITHDAAGNVYVADTINHTIRRIAGDGTVSTLAGMAGAAGEVDGTGSAARFNQPWGIALGPDGDLYVSDLVGQTIRRVTTAGVVSTYAGSSTAGYADGAPLLAKFDNPEGVAVAANGDVLVADLNNNRVRRIVRAGNAATSVTTLAGDGSVNLASPDGIGTAAVIVGPQGVYVRGNTLTVRDSAGLVRQIDLTTAAVTTLTGSRALGGGFADGPPAMARFDLGGIGITGAPGGGFIASDRAALRLIDAAGLVATIADIYAVGAQPGGTATLANQPIYFGSIAVDSAGRVVVADGEAGEVRRIDGSGTVSLVAGLTGGNVFNPGYVDGTGSAAVFHDMYSGPDGSSAGIAASPAGVVYVGDGFGVRRIATDNTVTTLAGSANVSGGGDGDAATARFAAIADLAVGPGGDVFVADTDNHAIRRIDAAGNVATYAGVIGEAGNADGPIASARLDSPSRIAFAADGTLYVVTNLGVVRAISPGGASVSTLAAVDAVAIAVDSDGTLYYAPSSGGLYRLPPGASAGTLLIPAASASVLGAAPQVSSIVSMALLAPRQLVVLTLAGELLVATLP